MATQLSMDPRTLPRRLTHSRWLGLAVGIVVVVAWAIFLRSQITALQAYTWDIAPLAFVVGILWGAIYFGGLGLCWALLLRAMSPTRVEVSLGVATRVWLGSMMTRYIPGNIWHVVSRVMLAERLGVPAGNVLTSASLEQVLTLLGALALFGLTLPFWSVIPAAQAWLLLLVPMGLLLLHPRIFGAALRWAAMRVGRPELAWDYTYSELLLLLTAYIGATLYSGVALFTVLWGLTDVSIAHLPLVIGAASLAWAVGYLSFFTPSGLGVREALLVALLGQIYPLPVAIVASLLFRLVATLGEVLAVTLAWGYGQIERKRERGTYVN